MFLWRCEAHCIQTTIRDVGLLHDHADLIWSITLKPRPCGSLPLYRCFTRFLSAWSRPITSCLLSSCCSCSFAKHLYGVKSLGRTNRYYRGQGLCSVSRIPCLVPSRFLLGGGYRSVASVEVVRSMISCYKRWKKYTLKSTMIGR
jgi:hypothetical protein